MKEWVYGRNAVFETLRAGRRQVFKLWVAEQTKEKGHLADVVRWCIKRKVLVERVPRAHLDALSEGHQGVALEASQYPYSTLFDILELTRQREEAPFLLVLDTLQDPQNLGTLLRTAEIVGVHGVLLPFRRTATITPAVVNASSGASEHLLVAQTNLAQAIRQLQQGGVWVVGLSSLHGARSTDQVRMDGALALVVGNEGAGMRPLVQTSCDDLLCLPMRGEIDSLNAAVAGSVALYFAWKARDYQGKRNQG